MSEPTGRSHGSDDLPTSSSAAMAAMNAALLPGDELEESLLLDAPAQGTPAYVAQVRLLYVNRVVTVDAGDLVLRRGDYVIVETERGLSMATVISAPACMRPSIPLLRIVRRVSRCPRRDFHRLRL